MTKTPRLQPSHSLKLRAAVSGRLQAIHRQTPAKRTQDHCNLTVICKVLSVFRDSGSGFRSDDPKLLTVAGQISLEQSLPYKVTSKSSLCIGLIILICLSLQRYIIFTSFHCTSYCFIVQVDHSYHASSSADAPREPWRPVLGRSWKPPAWRNVEKLPLPRHVMKPVMSFWDIHGAPKLCLLVLCIL